MSDLPPPLPLDEHATALLDAGVDAPAGDGALAERLAELRAVRAAVSDVPPPDAARREQAISAALAAFDADDASPGTVVPLAPRAVRRRGRWSAGIGGGLAVAAALVGVGILAARDDGGSTSAGGAALGRASTGTSGRAAAAEAAGTAAAGAQDGAQSAMATTAAASATTAAGGATTAAKATAPASAPATTTAAASGATTTTPAPATTTGVGAAIPYVGDVGSTVDLDRVIRRVLDTAPTTTTVAATGESGGDVRQAFAAATCALGDQGVPIALARYQGRPVVLTAAGDDVRMVGIDDCAVITTRPRAG